ncbi:hypothetical protein LCGC14_1689890 [marine sediment metagenome]|uniref:Uncharacterized protein n=1 Tax=marine sediment metagenome TaxID=412755 RepID=A0A0F9K1R8_9ZZZZ
MNDNQARCLAYLAEHSTNWVGFGARIQGHVLGLPKDIPLSNAEAEEMLAQGWVAARYYPNLPGVPFYKETDEGMRAASWYSPKEEKTPPRARKRPSRRD